MADEQDPIAGDDFGDVDDAEEAAPGSTVDEQPADDSTDASENGEVDAETPEMMADVAGSGGDALLGVLGDVVGGNAGALYGFGQRAGETLSMGLGSVLGKKPEIVEVRGRLGDFAELETAFADRAHVSADLRVAIDEAEIYTMAVVAPLEELGRLFTIDTSPEQMADEEFARGQLEVVSAGLKEFLDLAGLMLFSDGLAGAEVTLGDVRLRGVAETVAAVSAAGDPFALHLDITLGLEGEQPLTLSVAVPSGLLARIAALSGGDEVEAEAVAPPVFEERAATEDFDEPTLEPIAGGHDVEVHPVRFPTLGPADEPGGLSSMDLIMDVSLRVTVELGRSSLTVEEVLTLGPGSVIELNKLAGEPVDVLVNGRAIARGEVVVVDENFGVRVTEILSPRSRIEAVGR